MLHWYVASVDASELKVIVLLRCHRYAVKSGDVKAMAALNDYVRGRQGG